MNTFLNTTTGRPGPARCYTDGSIPHVFSCARPASERAPAMIIRPGECERGADIGFVSGFRRNAVTLLQPSTNSDPSPSSSIASKRWLSALAVIGTGVSETVAAVRGRAYGACPLKALSLKSRRRRTHGHPCPLRSSAVRRDPDRDQEAPDYGIGGETSAEIRRAATEPFLRQPCEPQGPVWRKGWRYFVAH